jgi:GH35 family endo-1,4-beta-xylanase
MVLAMSLCFFSGIATVFADSAASELEPEAIAARIAENRMGDLVVKAKPGATVHIEQLQHEFWFGATLASSAFSGRLSTEDQRRYEETFLANFNAAVTENAVKWLAMERRQGEVDYSIVDAMLAWTAEHDIPLRGHCVFWGIPNRVQDWLKQMNDDELRKTLKNRATDIGRRYRGRFAETAWGPA